MVANATDAPVRIVFNGEPQGMLDPGAELTLGQYLEGTTFGRVIAINASDERIFTPWVTWEFLVERNFRIEVIDQSSG